MSMNDNGIATECQQCEPNECSYNLRRRMGLDGELRSGGCAHHYLGKAFPKLTTYVRSLKLPTGTPLTTAPKGWAGFIGTAFDHCLRRERAPDQPNEIIREGLKSMLFANHRFPNPYLEGAVAGLDSQSTEERAYWASRIEEEASFGGKLREGAFASIDLLEGMISEIPEERALWYAILDRAHRAGSFAAQQQWASMTSGGNSLKQQLVSDINRLMGIARENFVLTKPEFGPTFGLSSAWIGGADADIIDEGCLIDIKCTKSPKATAFLRQVIGYALLDVDDEHRLDSVGIYLARQGIFWKVPLDDIVRQTGATLQQLRHNAPWGNPADREALRSEIAEAVSSDS